MLLAFKTSKFNLAARGGKGKIVFLRKFVIVFFVVFFAMSALQVIFVAYMHTSDTMFALFVTITAFTEIVIFLWAVFFIVVGTLFVCHLRKQAKEGLEVPMKKVNQKVLKK